ncbi:restriction endonuclease [Brevibacillus ruminantium]|uniref:Restriction endonuclease n=1 Tax=Brevibacillus ruminantium TaxID=2950604 RepID=A0ABY4WCM1_9BACL|nr:restriction endonuclease [Brevibacillus ruminantium]USG64803.1 restriction endonuclease [Brevibacillus ruminantium]
MLYLVLILVLASVVVITILLRQRTNKAVIPSKQEFDFNPLHITIEDIDLMEDGSDFEMYLYRLFLALGYKGVYKTVGSRDFGADLVFIDRYGTRNVIQAKRYGINNPVGIGAVQEIYSSMRFYKAKKSIVIASTSFTGSCETLAGINHVKLLDRNDLIHIITLFKQGEVEKVKDIIETEPRMILESWSEYTDHHREIKKDRKAEKLVQNT